MEILEWINKLELGDGLFNFVDNHYFKYLLFIKLTKGSNITVKDVKTCECFFSEDQLEISMKFKKKVDVPELSTVVGENIHKFDFNVDLKGSTMKVTIRNTLGAEVYSIGNLSNSNA